VNERGEQLDDRPAGRGIELKAAADHRCGPSLAAELHLPLVASAPRDYFVDRGERRALVVAQRVADAARQEEAVAARDRDRLRHAFHRQPAVPAHDHAERGVAGREPDAPRRGGVEPSVEDVLDLEGGEDVGDWIHAIGAPLDDWCAFVEYQRLCVLRSGRSVHSAKEKRNV